MSYVFFDVRILQCVVMFEVHFDLSNIMFVATKAHMILRRFVVLTWMGDN